MAIPDIEDDFWQVGDLPDTLEAYPTARIPKDFEELAVEIDRWKQAGQLVEIAYQGVGRVGHSFGHHALLGTSTDNPFILTACDWETCESLATRFKIEVKNMRETP